MSSIKNKYGDEVAALMDVIVASGMNGILKNAQQSLLPGDQSQYGGQTDPGTPRATEENAIGRGPTNSRTAPAAPAAPAAAAPVSAPADPFVVPLETIQAPSQSSNRVSQVGEGMRPSGLAATPLEFLPPGLAESIPPPPQDRGLLSAYNNLLETLKQSVISAGGTYDKTNPTAVQENLLNQMKQLSAKASFDLVSSIQKIADFLGENGFVKSEYVADQLLYSVIKESKKS